MAHQHGGLEAMIRSRRTGRRPARQDARLEGQLHGDPELYAEELEDERYRPTANTYTRQNDPMSQFLRGRF